MPEQISSDTLSIAQSGSALVRNRQEMDIHIAWPTWGLFLAWLLHDAEELITMPGWVARNRAQLEHAFPIIPWAKFDMPPSEIYIAITLMGVFIAAVSWYGFITRGRGWFFHMTLLGFGIHGVAHMLISVFVWAYSPGVLTSPIIVIPFSVWAWRALQRAAVVGPVRGRDILTALLFLPPVLIGVHSLAWIILRTVGSIAWHSPHEAGL